MGLMKKSPAWRSAVAVQIALISAIAAAVFMGIYGIVSNHGSNGGDTTAASEQSSAGGADGSGSSDAKVEPFTSASAGSCVTWDINEDGSAASFKEVECSEQHRFEVSTVEDLSVYPTSEFGPDASRPALTRQHQLRDELCESATVSYLHSKWDPHGKYDIASILPPESAWDNGDRTLLCGLQTTDDRGVPQLTTGNVEASEQANLTKPGECLAIDDKQVPHVVDCGQPHQLETVSVIDLGKKFPDAYPDGKEMDKFLSDSCTAAAEDYLGGEEQLYQSTLQPFWGTVSEESWNGGTKSVNCSLVHARDDGGFSSIPGAATGGRQALSIDGNPPEERPERNPIRDNKPAP